MLDIEDPRFATGDIPGYYEFRSSLAKYLKNEYASNVNLIIYLYLME